MNYDIFSSDALIVDYRVDEKSRVFLESLNKKLIYTFKREDLYEEIDGHPDIIGVAVGKKTILEPIFCDMYKDLLCEYNVVRGHSAVEGKYPNDIKYNVAVLKGVAIGKIDSIDLNLLRCLKDDEFDLIFVNQGYSRCSTVVLNENSIITADKSIEKACEGLLEVCLIEQDRQIKLGDMQGFIGGSSFVYDNKLVFFGDIKKHRSYKIIKDFVESKDMEIFCIDNEVLMDYGSVVPLYKK